MRCVSLSDSCLVLVAMVPKCWRHLHILLSDQYVDAIELDKDTQGLAIDE